jgi:hypothetical protein
MAGSEGTQQGGQPVPAGHYTLQTRGVCKSQHYAGPRASLLVAFLFATRDVVIDAWRVEILEMDLQGPGTGMIQTATGLPCWFPADPNARLVFRATAPGAPSQL